MALAVDDAQARFDALSSPVRREILWLTWTDELSVGAIGAHFDLSGPTLSAHLAILRNADLVTLRADGNFRRYRCNHEVVRALVPFLAASDGRWVVADDIPERALASSERSIAVTVDVEVPVDPATAFAAFTEEDRYSAWLGVPVTIRDGRFRTTMEWGTEVRGIYDVVHRPELIAMRWDLDDDAVPVPGQEMVAYLRIHPTARGSRVEVHQMAPDEERAEFLTQAWAMVLGRFAQAHADHAPASSRRRSPRPKRRS
ncbi:MAG TPA: metalloregulator ArsR/SmtB family transcription factor [Iamia sp.]|jgi:DNA-binding transcriptional ArsR family regulator|nr:metalloregulator ArsR/SmtB family transcription factor [Iamia sp.]